MYSIHNRDDLEKLNYLQETKSLLHKERLKEKLGKQDLHYDMKFLKLLLQNRRKLLKTRNNYLKSKFRQLQAINQQLHDSSQTTRQAIAELSKNQTRAIKEEYKKVIIIYKKTYNIIMKLQIVITSFLRVLLIPTKLILVSLRQFPTFLMTKTKVNLV